MCQSSNDVHPERHPRERGARQRGASCCRRSKSCARVLGSKEHAWSDVLKTGRTHLMDATPMTLGQEVSGWRAQIDNAIERLRASEPRLLALAQGGTAIGTGINAHEKFAARFIEELRGFTGLPFTTGGELLRRHGLAGRGGGISPASCARWPWR